MQYNATALTCALLFSALTTFATSPSQATQSTPTNPPPMNIQLSHFEKRGGLPFIDTVANRKSSRAFAPIEIPIDLLSQILWCTAGYNRPEQKMRVAASSRNRQSVEVLAILPSGIYAYDAEQHALIGLVAGDYRTLAGAQDFVATAPLNLVFVGDTQKIGIEDPEARALSLGCDAGLMAQNTYLFCSSKGLATVIRAWIEHEPLAKLLQLPPNKKVLFGQTIGFPARQN